NLFDTTHVFVRVDRVKQLLEQPYGGLYRVLKHISDNLFLIDYKGKETIFSTERLKPTHVELHEEQQHRTYGKASVSSALSYGSSDLEGSNVATVISARMKSAPSLLKLINNRKFINLYFIYFVTMEMFSFC
ncbi:hypothetical protein WN51_14325, partial [Melipona quadrifasciata]